MSAVEELSPEPNRLPNPRGVTTRAADALLAVYADALDDIEATRIANTGRLRSLRSIKGLDGTPEEARLSGLIDALTTIEHGIELELKRALRKHPLGPWIKQTVGVGEKQGARLLAAIGDPATRQTVSQLWAYCGYHVVPAQAQADTQGGYGWDNDFSVQGVDQTHMTVDRDNSHPDQVDNGTQGARVGVAPSLRRGHRINWNPTAKMRAFLVAESCMKAVGHGSVPRSPYRDVYEGARTKYDEAIHSVECKRCGPAGAPALVGSQLNDGHKHARALRLVAKTILRDLWIEARRVSA